MNVALFLTNVVGALAYVYVSSHGWGLPQEHGLQANTGEPFVWALYVLPIWALFCSVDLIWGAMIAIRRTVAQRSPMVVSSLHLAHCSGNRFYAPLR